ncbi:Hint domain-containing protein [Stigmatella erecta]|uniref:Intein N-terminal splicing region n=1 Tax=Stigmatella erecta TaxID=83460 RepID=A0A1I0LCS3_9BACT|nr:Hint domain-containing protein [Stigmatella erecta]SEU37140.1 intein N-terminal splicing region [Stigmatella erecta]
MKGLFGACATLFAAGFLLPSLAEAQPILQQRCSADSLDSGQAERRLLWARRCGLLTHVGSTGNWFDTYAPSSNNAGTLKDYAEDNIATNWAGQNTYTGQSEAFELNSSFVSRLYLSGLTYQYTDGDGFFRWERPLARKKARPLYPTFGSQGDIYSPSNQQLFPHPSQVIDGSPLNCSFYLNQAGTIPATGMSFYVNGYCEASCYTPDQKVRFPEGDVAIVEAVASMKKDVVTLTPDSSLDAIQLQTNKTYSYTAEFRDTAHPVVQLEMASGGKLTVTTEHPLINSEGRLVTAQTIKVGDELVKVDGSFDQVVRAERKTHFGKVYNLRPDTDERLSNILVAEGYLVGSSLFQNDEVGYVNRIILHRQVPASLIP